MAHPILRLLHPDGTVHVYGAASLEREGDLSVEESAGVDAVEGADCEVVVDGPLLGAADEAGLPVPDAGPGADGDHAYRALLSWAGDDGSETAVVDGYVWRRGGVRRVPERDAWEVTVEDGAERRFLELLDTVDLGTAATFTAARDAADAAEDAGDDRFLRRVVRDEWAADLVDGQFVSRLERSGDDWLDPVHYWTAAVEGVLSGAEGGPAVTWAGPRTSADAFAHAVVFKDAAGQDRTYVHRPVVGVVGLDDTGRPATWEGQGAATGPDGPAPAALVGLTARAMYEALAAARAWRLVAEPDPFPGTGLTARVLADGAAVVGAVALDGRLEGAPEDRETPRTVAPPALPDLAVAAEYEADEPPDDGVYRFRPVPGDNPADAQRDRRDQRRYGTDAPAPYERAEAVVYRPDPYDLRAAGPGAGPLRLDADGRPDHADLVELPWGLLHMGPAERVDERLGAAPASGGQAESFGVLRSAGVATTYAALGASGGYRAGLFVAELHRRPEAEGRYRLVRTAVWTGSGHLSGGTAVSAERLVTAYGLSTAETVEVEAAFDVAGLDGAFAVGDPSRGVLFEGHAWLVRRRTWSPETATATLTLARPADAAAVPAGAPALPSPVGAPAVTATADTAAYDPATGDGVVVTFEWTEPAAVAERGPVAGYETRHARPGTPYTGWALRPDGERTQAVAGGLGAYYLDARAVYEGGERGPVGRGSAVVADPTGGPVRNLRVVDRGADWARLAWDAHPFAPAAGTAYELGRSPTSGAPYETVTAVAAAALADPDAPEVRVEGLPAGRHFFAVRVPLAAPSL